MWLRPWASTAIVGLASFLLLAGARGQRLVSEYTRLTQPTCKTTHVQAEGANSEQLCPGVHGYKLVLLDSDGRMSATIVAPGGSRHPLDFWDTVTPHFSVVGKTAEWRVSRQGGAAVPLALILRLGVQEDAETNKATSYLVVVRLNGSAPCAVAKIAPGATANAEARRAADRVPGGSCLKQ